MSRFTQELILSPQGDGNWQVRNTELVWEVRVTFYEPGVIFPEPVPHELVVSEVEIPYGFVTDLASVPRILWPIIASFGKHSTAAVLHDYLYRKAGKHNWSRRWCDDQFYEAMLALGTHRFRAGVMYRAVRLFGQRSFQRPYR